MRVVRLVRIWLVVGAFFTLGNVLDLGDELLFGGLVSNIEVVRNLPELRDLQLGKVLDAIVAGFSLEGDLVCSTYSWFL